MNIQQLRTQIAALQSATMDENKNFRSAYDEGKFDALSAVDALLDSLQEEPVSEDLGGYSDLVADHLMQRTAEFDISSVRKLIKDAFKSGAKWQKEQMMSKAIVREVKVDSGGYPYIDTTELYDYDKDMPLAKEGDKVKVIVIKED